MNDITVDPASGAAFRQIAEQIRSLIQRGILEPGSALPSVRSLARQVGTSSLTVHLAYSQLQGQGLVTSSPRRGTRVAFRLRGEAGRSHLGRLAGEGPVSNYELTAESSSIRSMASSVGDPRLFRHEDLIAEIEALRRESPWNFYYSDPAGAPELLAEVSRMVTGEGLPTAESDLVMTDGSSRAIDLVLGVTTSPGDVVLVQEPGRLYLRELLNFRGLTPAVIRSSGLGVDIDHLAACAENPRVKAIFISPDFGHGTGLSMPEDHRIGVVRVATDRGLTIIEDGSCGQLRFGARQAPPISSFDPEISAYVGSLSYTLCPGVRTGFIRAPHDMRKAVIATSQASGVSGPRFLQLAVARYLASGSYETHLRAVRRKYQSRKEAAMSALHSWEGSTWTKPSGGLSTWVTVPEGCRTSALYVKAIERGLAFAPGRLFLTAGDPDRHLRLSYGRLEPETLREAISELGYLVAANSMTLGDPSC